MNLGKGLLATYCCFPSLIFIINEGVLILVLRFSNLSSMCENDCPFDKLYSTYKQSAPHSLMVSCCIVTSLQFTVHVHRMNTKQKLIEAVQRRATKYQISQIYPMKQDSVT